MAYRLKLKEPVAEGVRRVGLEQIEIAEAKLASDKDVPASIHDARRCLKRLRALLHLVRPGLDKDAYRREAEQLAAIGKLLSRARDRYVMQQTLAKLETQPGSLPKATATKAEETRGARQSGQQQSQDHRRRPPPRARASEAGAQAVQRQGHRGARSRSSGRGPRRHLSQGAQGASARPTPSRATRPSTPGARQRSAIGATCCCSPMAGRKRCWRGPARPRSCRASWARTTTTPSWSPSRSSRATRRSAARIAHRSKAVCRSRQDELRALAKPRGDRLFAESDASFKDRIALYWSSAACLSDLTPAREPEAKKGPAPAKKAKRVRRRPRQTAPPPIAPGTE